MPEYHECDGLRLLSLDGGGIRGLFQLLILQHIMERIQFQETLKETPLPCDYFDLIGGSRTGGLIALMLGRLRMSVTEAIEIYGTLTQGAFSEVNEVSGDGRLSASRLENVIKKIVKKRTGKADARMIGTGSDYAGCKTFVCAIATLDSDSSAGIPRLFRTYQAPRNPTFNCTIWQAVRATSTTPKISKRMVTSGSHYSPDGYVDRGGSNNPIVHVIEEAKLMFPHRRVSCIVSIGTGKAETIFIPKLSLFQRVLPFELVIAMRRIATACERSAQEIERRFQGTPNTYFRFNVEQGLQEIGLAQWDRLEEVTAHMEQYIGMAELDKKFGGVVAAILQGQKAFTTMGYVVEQGDLYVEHYRQVRLSICSPQSNQANLNRHRQNMKDRLSGTCDWLMTDPEYLTWQNGTADPILWLHAPSGFGKSCISSYVIQLIQDLDPNAAVVYHFYRFDQLSECDTLRLLAIQLFECFWERSHTADKKLFLKAQQSPRSLSNVQELIIMLVKSLPKVYFIIDGLDEETGHDMRWTEATTVLDFLNQLSMASPSTVRVWYSSQYQTRITKKLKAYKVFDIKDQIKKDVASYLSRAILELKEEQNMALENLRSRAEGNFLWARLMIKALREDTGEMTGFIEHGLPKGLDEYYSRFFERIEEPQRALACKVFSMITFARRPLRLGEIREAIGILLQGKTSRFPDVTGIPFISYLRVSFAPLIEIKELCSDNDLDNCTCHLFHSSVKEFLTKYPHILATNLLISPRVLADACLSYLFQSRYAQLLTRPNCQWIDALGEPVNLHQYLLYAAKYWARHLDILPENTDLRRRVESFLTSSNFHTCIQVQSLWVDGEFRMFRPFSDQRCQDILRVFPTWFTRGSAHGQNMWRNYCGFVQDWKHLLDNPGFTGLPHSGEIDRCWWAALGPQNFLSGLKGRYTTFRLQADEDDHYGKGRRYEDVSAAGDKLKVLRLKSRIQGTLKFVCEHWSLPNNRLPTLEKRQVILAQEKDTRWFLYTKHTGDESMMRVGGTAPTTFSSNCRFLRIGAQIFELDDKDEYISMPGLCVQKDAHHGYIEEFAIRGQFTVLAKRREMATEGLYQTGIQDKTIDGFGTDFIKMEETLTHSFEWSDDDDDDADNESDSSYGSSTDSEDQAHESWSECSTEHSEDFQFQDDIIQRASPIDIEHGGSSKSSDEEAEESDNQSEVSESVPDPEWSDLPVSAVIGHKRSHEPQVYLTVFDTSQSVPRRIFHFSRKFTFMLYSSLPVVHPFKALVVWPLGGGDVLFADFVAKTYFMRRIQPSTSNTRHALMKCHFSPCGRYLHIASLEEQRESVPRQSAESPLIKLALLLLTYRLSGRKTTKSAPTLIHRVRLNLGSQASLSVSKLPYTLTWTANELYFTCSANTLSVYRICLFDDLETSKQSLSGHGVLIPRKTIFLPSTALRRQVYYFPPADGSTVARIIVGSDVTVRTADVNDEFLGAPPFVCYLQEQADLGGWEKSGDCSNIPRDLDIGRLDPCLEKFDSEEDCDLDPYNFIPRGMGIGRLNRRSEQIDFEEDCDLDPHIF